MALKESTHKFIDPIRYFKENDPYYWEVDNIPLKQLQENCLWLKDQIEIVIGADEGIGRSVFTELQPYATGSDNTVKVRKGRFTARINDAYSLTPLQKIEKLAGVDYEYRKYKTNAALSVTAQQFLESLQSSILESSYNLNGLIERTLSWPTATTVDLSGIISYDAYDVGNSTNLPKFGDMLGRWPIFQNVSFLNNFQQTESTAKADLQRLSLEFVRRFRGVARTAVVDVSEELSIDIPDFDPNDFGYYDESDQFIRFENAAIRIDLLFIYSKPIDTESVAIQKWGSQTTPTIITRPTLGIVKGAGVLLRKITGLDGLDVVNSIDGENNSQILAQIADTNSNNNGFKELNIHGSFPSPDDLVNLAPLLSEKLEFNDPRLIGQTILPVAYVVVRNNQIISSEGVPVVNAQDVIDIRPFFRTTELTYNERAGLAAAIPSPSLANPVATAWTVQQTSKKVFDYANNTFEKKGRFYNTPEIIAAGYILGGTQYGPEGQIPAGASNFLSQRVAAGTNLSISPYPEWDPAPRVANDPTVLTAPYWSDFLDVVGLSTGNIRFLGYEYGQLNKLTFRKKITITNVANRFPDCVDFMVKLNYFNCAPKTGQGVSGRSSPEEGLNGVNVDYAVAGLYCYKTGFTPTGDIQFTIVCENSVAALGWFSITLENNKILSSAGTGVMQSFYLTNETGVGACIYPSVSFEVIGFKVTGKPTYRWVDTNAQGQITSFRNTMPAFGTIEDSDELITPISEDILDG